MMLTGHRDGLGRLLSVRLFPTLAGVLLFLKR
jgi:hypothetical protein